MVFAALEMARAGPGRYASETPLDTLPATARRCIGERERVELDQRWVGAAGDLDGMGEIEVVGGNGRAQNRELVVAASSFSRRGKF